MRQCSPSDSDTDVARKFGPEIGPDRVTEATMSVKRWLDRARHRSAPEVPDPPPEVVVWNRACDYDYQPCRTGDKALKAAIQFDGLTCNGGLGHTLDVLTETEVREAVAAFRHLGLTEAARVVEDALALPDEGPREALTDRYFTSTQGLLEMAFERHYVDHPDQYAPVS